MNQLVMIAQLLAGLSLLVFVHELGHYLAARAFGIRVNKFFIFFDAWGKKLFSKKIGDTEYGIGWLPLGGYVQIAGMVDETQNAEQMAAIPEPWEFRAKPAWQRMIVMVSGVVMNVIVGVLIFALFLSRYEKEYLPLSEVNKEGIFAYPAAEEIGLKTGDKILAVNGDTPERFKDAASMKVYLGGTLTVERDGRTFDVTVPEGFYKRFREPFISPMRESVFVEEVSSGSGAAAAGMQSGDQIVGVDSVEVNRFSTLRETLQAHKQQTVNLTVLRNGTRQTLTAGVDTAGLLGFRPRMDYPYAFKPYTLGEAFSYGMREGYDITVTQIVSFGMLFAGKVKVTESLGSPIAIAQMYGSQWDWARFWRLTGLISFVLAFMNILPIPALDGGHMVFLAFEMVTRRKLSDAFLERAQMVGMFLLLALMLFAFGNDIYKIFAGKF